jgi:hypothetical protein
MTKLIAISALIALSACDALTIAGSNRISDNVAVSVGTTITDEGVQRPRGKLTVGLF